MIVDLPIREFLDNIEFSHVLFNDEGLPVNIEDRIFMVHDLFFRHCKSFLEHSGF